MASQQYSNHGSLPNMLHDDGAEDYIQQNLSNRDCESILSNDKLEHGKFVYKRFFTEDNRNKSLFQQPLHTKSFLTGRFEMSPVRRMFCLLVLFDCLMTFLMWIIYLQIAGGFMNIVKEDVIHYNFKQSYFDILAISFGRCILLLLAYACIFKSKKWYMIALTTAGSTGLLIAKVFMNEFKRGAPLNYLLIIYSFVICWCEAWHFDYQVLPHEMDTKPELLPDSVTNVKDYLASLSRGPHSAAYFTPYAGSVYKEASNSRGSESSLSNLSQELQSIQETDRTWVGVGKNNVHAVFRILYINDDWYQERRETDNIVVYTRHFQGVGKVFKAEAQLDVASHILDKLLWEDIEAQPTWNSSVKECQIFRRINKKTDIIYSVSAEAAGGVIANRDFVVLRRRKKKGPLTLLCGVSIETDLVPKKSNIIRGHNGPCGFILRNIPDEPDKTELIWLLNTDIKGWLPSRLVEQSLGGVMVNTVRDIRKYLLAMPPV